MLLHISENNLAGIISVRTAYGPLRKHMDKILVSRFHFYLLRGNLNMEDFTHWRTLILNNQDIKWR